MKKLLSLLTFTLLVFLLQAQDFNLLQSIKAAGDNVKTLEAQLDNITVRNGKLVRSQTGPLYCVSPNEFAALFETGQYMIVNEKQIKVDIGLFHGTFKLKEGGRMRMLSNIFLCSFQGQCQKLAEENGYNIDIETDEYHTVIFTKDKKSLFGVNYKKIIFNFNKSDLHLKEIILYDSRGTRDNYIISNPRYNVDVSPDIFNF